ncbi:MAG: hypothetical protein ACKOX6_16240 [Bdellovibrio sp.]
MKVFVILSFLFLSLSVHAQELRMKQPQPAPEPHQLHFYLLDIEMRYEKDAADEWVDRKPMNFGIAYRAPRWSLLFEYAQFTEASGNSTLSIDRTHEEMLFWGRWHLWSMKAQRTQVSVYGAGGAGVYQENVKTALNGSSETNTTGYKVMTGLAAGADMSYLFTRSFGVVAALEGRGLIASEFDPNPTWSAVVRTGILFRW